MTDFLKFEKIKIKTAQISDDPITYQLSVEPLERGFSVTLGNAMRRVMLSHVPGVSTYAAVIEGVSHEFSTIKGIHDSVTDIILRLKSLVIKVPNVFTFNEKECFLTLKTHDIGKILAKDIECPEGIEILNKNFLIATATKKDVLKIKIYIRSGKGYCDDKQNLEYIEDPNAIVFDSAFGCVQNANYVIDTIKSSDQQEREKLILNFETNGSVYCDQIIGFVARTLEYYFHEIGSVSENIKLEDITLNIKTPQRNIHLDKKIEELNLPVRCYNCLKAIGIQYVYEIIDMGKNRLKTLKNLGEKSFNDIVNAINNRGIKF
ncbi:DNA-directed RNA polymerase subunit alpha [symbiont of Argiope bruennichi]|uniref:DNA-directed RNA polymerase subunit alpha n=1 Tax=symbiont of Argiope bruennichi TaxID=2810479 RepID=UPI003DA2B187